MFFKEYNNLKYFSLGRDAISFVIENLEISKDEKILLPNLICDVVIPSFSKFYENIYFYQLDSKLEPINLDDFKNVKVLFIINYFGFTQNIENINNYCIKNNILLIEDNAHGLFSKDEKNQYLGTRGDFGIFSYRKTFLLPDGGFLYQKNINTKSNYIFNSNNPSFKFFIKKIVINLSVKFKYNILLKLRKLINIIYSKKIILNHNFNEQKNLPLEYSFKFINQVDEEVEFNRRRSLYLFIEKKLANYNISPIFDFLPDNTCPYGFPFYVLNEKELQNVISFSNKLGYECVYWPDLPNDSELTFNDGNIGKIFFINFTYQ